MGINALKYNNMFIFLTLIFSTIAGNRINSFRIPFADESPVLYSKREAESGGELEQTDFLPTYDDNSMRSIPMEIPSGNTDPEGFNIYDYLGGF